jgi:hypothetical protein
LTRLGRRFQKVSAEKQRHPHLSQRMMDMASHRAQASMMYW